MFKSIASMMMLIGAASASMKSWDTTCGSKYDRIVTKKLNFKGTGRNGGLNAGAKATIGTSGVTQLHGPFSGGSWSVRVYEQGAPKPVGDFFGDLAKVLTFPDNRNTTFSIKGVSFPLPKRKYSGIFQAAFTAQDFTKSAYFCVDIFYTLDSNGEAVIADASSSSSPSLVLPTFAPSSDPYTVTKSEGNFTVDSVTMTTKTGKFMRKALATVTVKGKTKKDLLSGAVSWQLYETGVRSFIASGNEDYFVCSNKGCDLTKPLSLTLTDTSGKAGSDYTLTFTFVMAKRQRGGTSEFRLVFWGADQDHFPYDFSSTITYNSRN